MGKKKKKVVKVWCYYCDREFDDEKILVQHQKAKHFKCNFCHKKLSTAGGLVIHVLQVHKESILKVPNAKPGRDSTEIEIFGMEGIPPDVLAAHDGEDEERPTKVAKTEVPSSGLSSMVMGSTAFGMAPQSLYSPIRPVFAQLPSGARPPVWMPQPLMPRPWSTSANLLPMRPPLPPPSAPQPPLFPIQQQVTLPPPPPNAPNIPVVPSQPPAEPLFPIHPPPPSQPLFPISGPASVSPIPAPMSSMSQPLHYTSPKPSHDAWLPPGSAPIPTNSSLMMTMKPQNLTYGGHMYASGPNTGGPSIGPPPVISNKAPGHTTVNEVYLVWDDEAMSMEERRLSLPEYQVHDEAFQMNSVDAAIDRRISESRLAGRMSFGV